MSEDEISAGVDAVIDAARNRDELLKVLLPFIEAGSRALRFLERAKAEHPDFFVTPVEPDFLDLLETELAWAKSLRESMRTHDRAEGVTVQ